MTYNEFTIWSCVMKVNGNVFWKMKSARSADFEIDSPPPFQFCILHELITVNMECSHLAWHPDPGVNTMYSMYSVMKQLLGKCTMRLLRVRLLINEKKGFF